MITYTTSYQLISAISEISDLENSVSFQRLAGQRPLMDFLILTEFEILKLRKKTHVFAIGDHDRTKLVLW